MPRSTYERRQQRQRALRERIQRRERVATIHERRVVLRDLMRVPRRRTRWLKSIREYIEEMLMPRNSWDLLRIRHEWMVE